MTMRFVEALETRSLLSSYAAGSVADLIADMNAANTAGGSNTITLRAGTTLKLSAVDNNVDGANGLPAIASGNDLTIVGNGGMIQRRATAAFRLFDVAAGASLSLNNLTLAG